MIVPALLAFAFQSASLPLPAEARAPEASAPLAATAREERQAGRALTCSMEAITGSRFPVRRCRPAALSPQEEAAASDELRRVQILREVPVPGTIRNGG